MDSKTSILGDILANLPDNEADMIEKTATDASSIKTTEEKEASKKIPTDTPTKTEKKLGLGGLSGLQKELFHEIPSVPGKTTDGGVTGNDEQAPLKVEPGTTFEKKASADILETLLETAGIVPEEDLAKTASVEENEGLLKLAHDTLTEMNDLEKVAQVMAESAADKFLKIIAEKA